MRCVIVTEHYCGGVIMYAYSAILITVTFTRLVYNIKMNILAWPEFTGSL